MSDQLDPERHADNRKPARHRECVTHHYACGCREEKFRRALADAIRRPMGVIPDSANEFLQEGDLEEAEARRPRASQVGNGVSFF